MDVCCGSKRAHLCLKHYFAKIPRADNHTDTQRLCERRGARVQSKNPLQAYCDTLNKRII